MQTEFLIPRAKRLHKELKEDARKWATKKPLNDLFLTVTLVWIVVCVVSGIMAHHHVQSLTPAMTILAILVVGFVPPLWIYIIQRNGFMKSSEFRHQVFLGLKARLDQLHRMKRTGVRLLSGGEIVEHEIGIAEYLYQDMTSSVYRYEESGELDVPSKPITPYPDPGGRYEFLGIGAGCTSPSQFLDEKR